MHPDDKPFSGLDALMEDLGVPNFADWAKTSKSYRFEFHRDERGQLHAERQETEINER